MARFVYEFFRPWGAPALYPLAVIAQDEQELEYREIPGVDIPDSFKTGFFLLAGRGDFIRDRLLPRLGISDRRDQAAFDALRGRATHRFLYSEAEDRPGTAAEVAGAEAARLGDADALRDLGERYRELMLAE
jgi:hypothetical protein